MAHHKVPRFTHTFVIYEGGALPSHYNGNLFGVGPLQGHVVYSQVDDDRSSFQTKDLGHVLTSSDTWVRPVDIQVGPDGAIYVADMYEQRIDHASHYQGRIHRESGRVYRLRSKTASYSNLGDLSSKSTTELVELLSHSNKWVRQTSLRLIADRRDRATTDGLKQVVAKSSGQTALEAFWAVNLCGGFDEEYAAKTLFHDDPYVRQWTVRLLCDDNEVESEMGTQLVQLANQELNVRVRSQLASSARRLPADSGLPIVQALLGRTEDADDIHVPLLLWWAIEAKAESDRDAVVKLFANADVWRQPTVEKHILSRLMRRFASTGKRADLLACAKLLDAAPERKHRDVLLAGFEEAFAGRSLSGLPNELLAALAKSGGGSLALRLRQGNKDALREALKQVATEKTKTHDRVQLVRVFGELRSHESLPVLSDLLSNEKDTAVLSAVLGALQSFDDEDVGARIIDELPRLSGDALDVAHTTLASRPAWSKQLIAAAVADEKTSKSIPLSIVRKMLLHSDDKIAAVVKQHWGDVEGASTDEMVAEMKRITSVVSRGSGNPYNGKVLYKNSCGKCHRLFEDGGEIGPNLTSYKRDDFNRVLANVVNPSLEIREGFETFVLATDDGRVLTGFIEDQDNQVIVLKQADGQRAVIPRDSIEDMRASKTSVMPVDLLKKMSEQELRDLFAYLRASQPLP